MKKISSYQKLKLKIEKQDELLGRKQELLSIVNKDVWLEREKNDKLANIILEMIEEGWNRTLK